MHFIGSITFCHSFIADENPKQFLVQLLAILRAISIKIISPPTKNVSFQDANGS